jgi:predicted transcriptional regulator
VAGTNLMRSSNEVVDAIVRLASCGMAVRRIAVELGIARNTVRRYVRGATQAPPPPPRLLEERAVALAMFENGEGTRNASAIRREMWKLGYRASTRSVQRWIRSVKKSTTIPPEAMPASEMVVIAPETQPQPLEC